MRPPSPNVPYRSRGGALSVTEALAPSWAQAMLGPEAAGAFARDEDPPADAAPPRRLEARHRQADARPLTVVRQVEHPFQGPGNEERRHFAPADAAWKVDLTLSGAVRGVQRTRGEQLRLVVQHGRKPRKPTPPLAKAVGSAEAFSRRKALSWFCEQIDAAGAILGFHVVRSQNCNAEFLPRNAATQASGRTIAAKMPESHWFLETLILLKQWFISWRRWSSRRIYCLFLTSIISMTESAYFHSRRHPRRALGGYRTGLAIRSSDVRRRPTGVTY